MPANADLNKCAAPVGEKDFDYPRERFCKDRGGEKRGNRCVLCDFRKARFVKMMKDHFSQTLSMIARHICHKCHDNEWMTGEKSGEINR